VTLLFAGDDRRPSGGRRLIPSEPALLGFPVETDLGSLEADVAVVGIPFGVPYPFAASAICANAPAAIRRRSARLTRYLDHHDFDLDGPMLPPGHDRRPSLVVVDVGDVPGAPDDGTGNTARAETAIRKILDRQAVPIVLGGDDSVPIPALRAYAGRGPLTVLQVDAHLDFRDEVAGIRDGYSSPMRRAAEMKHVERIVQVGLRGVGSARESDVGAAISAGNALVTARQLREAGAETVLQLLPAGGSVFVAFDCDGLDPSVCPAVSAPAPGGLSYDEAADLLGGAPNRCRVVGAAFTELVPERDINELSALVVVRLVMRLLGAMARSDRASRSV
jgi:agmatinase